MKNLFKFMVVLLLFFTTLSYAQEYANDDAETLITESKKPKKRYKIFCTTYSCCGLAGFGIEIWTDRECGYIEIFGKSSFTILTLKNTDNTDFTGNEIDIKQDIVLVDKENDFEKEGLEQIMAAGKYKVINGQVAFEPLSRKIRIKKICYVEEHTGALFGHEYSFSSSVCIYYPTYSKSSKALDGGYAVVKLNLNEEVLTRILNNNRQLQLDRDLIINNEIILKAGNYHLDEDGKIYTRNIYLK